MELIICPLCNHTNTGKVGNRQYYCRECLIEFQMNRKNQAKPFYVEEDGSLVELKTD